MATPTNNRTGGRKRATTYAYTAPHLGVHKPRLSGENRTVKALIEAALESGIGHHDAVRLAISVYKEIDVLARDEHNNTLGPSSLKDIRTYCRAILRSGTTFSAFEIAQRAVATWKLVATELVTLHAEWDRESVSRRLKLRETRQAAAAKLKEPASVLPLPAPEKTADD